MPKKMSITRLCAILIAIVALFAASQAGAQEDPDFCPPITNEAGRYTIILKDGFPSPVEGGFSWVYQITADPPWKIKIIRDVFLTYPDCCGEDIKILEPADPHITPPCGSALRFRQWPKVCDDFTLKLPFTKPNRKDGEITIITATNNIGISTFGIRTTHFGFFVAAIAGPACAPNVALENEPVLGKTFFKGEEFDWNLLLDKDGNSFDVECPNNDCIIDTLQLEDIEFSSNGVEPGIESSSEQPSSGFLDSLPFDEPFVASSSPGCTYVRTRSGGVKRLCR
jgi:hypothetical protein